MTSQTSESLLEPGGGLPQGLALLRRQLRTYWGTLLLAGLAFTPLLWAFFVLLWNRPAYQFFPMAICASVIFAWRAVEDSRGLTYQPEPKGAFVLFFGTGVLCLLANLKWSPWLGYMAFVTGLVAVVWSMGGKRLFLVALPALAMLAVIAPPPLNLDMKLTIFLRGQATELSSVLLDWLSVTHLKEGNTIQIPGRSLFMEEACSGINSFVLCNVFCLFCVFWGRRPLWWLALALPITSTFVVLGNIIRITLCGTADYYWHVDLLNGWQHEALGLLLLLGYCLVILSLDQLLYFFTLPVKARPLRPGAAVADAGPAGASASANTGFFWLTRCAGTLLGALFLLGIAVHIYQVRQKSINLLPTFLTLRQNNFRLPETLGDWKKIPNHSEHASFLETAGIFSYSWKFQNHGFVVAVGVDYPFSDYHDVATCYQAGGWRVLAEERMLQTSTQQNLHEIKLDLQKALIHSLVLHSMMNDLGQWVDKPLNGGRGAAAYDGHRNYRVQMCAGGYMPVSAEQLQSMQVLFLQVRQQIFQQLMASEGHPVGS